MIDHSPPPTITQHREVRGRLALSLALVSLVISIVPVLGIAAIPTGLLAAILGARTRASLRAHHRPTSIGSAAILIGVLATAVALLMLTVLVATGTSTALTSQIQ